MTRKQAGSSTEIDAELAAAEAAIDAFEGEPEGDAGADQAAGALFDKDAFWNNFKGAFNAGSAVTQLQSLAVADDDGQARAAADTIYDIAAETPWLRFLIDPSSVWAQRAVVILMFAVPKAAAVSAELNTRRQPPAPEPVAEPAATPTAEAVDAA